MSDIFREVDEALQQEKWVKIWKEYGSTIIAALVVLVVSTALMTAYRSWDAKRDATETARLMEALDSDSPAQNIQKVIENTRKSHQALGLMAAAGLLIEEGEKTQAAGLYKQAATSRRTPRDLRDLARILYLQNVREKDINILKPLLGNKKSPWIWHARIEAAVISAHQDNDYARALAYLAPFDTVSTIPLSLKQRAQALSHVYRLKASAQQPSAQGAAK